MVLRALRASLCRCHATEATVDPCPVASLVDGASGRRRLQKFKTAKFVVAVNKLFSGDDSHVKC